MYLTRCFFFLQAFADLSDKLEPLVDGVKKNREHWLNIAKEGFHKNHIQDENNKNDC